VIYKKISICVLLLLNGIFCANSQEILTAGDFFNRVAATYGAIADYQADVTITRAGVAMSGVIFQKTPNKLRINFSTPEEQVIVFDGKALVIYIPRYRVIMSQTVNVREQIAGGASLATREGLVLLKRNYSVAYLESPNYVPLDKESGRNEMVIKLRLIWRSTQEGFREIDIAVGANGYIRRIIGITPESDSVQFDFKNIVVNQNIPDTRFEYDPPASANKFENFLFDPSN
jgi:chaperone LolA